MQTSSSDGNYGALEVKVLETKEISINFITVHVGETSKVGELKKSHAKSHQFSDDFRFQVQRADAQLSIKAWRKNMLFKEKLKGVFKVPISDFLDEQSHTGWYPLTAPVKSSADEDDKQSHPVDHDKKKSKKGKTSEVRLQIKFTKNTPPKEVLTGIVLHDQWTKETSGGPLANTNPKWSISTQFLLNVDNPTEVIIKLRQPEECTQRVTFSIAHYDEFFNGRRKVLLDTSEVVKIDNFINPIPSHSVTSNMHLENGRYIIVPYSETVYAGPFTLAVSAKNMDDLDLYKIPKDPADDWKVLRATGQWTANTAGGGDIMGLNWRKNPQYQLQLTTQSDVCIVIEQDENTRSVGMYMVRQIDIGKRIVDYSGEVSKTDNFKYLCSSGHKVSNLQAGHYVIIPCTFEAGVEGPFRLVAYSTDPNATLGLLETEWKHSKEIKGGWTEGQAGGSPNNDTFTNNPQYALKFNNLQRSTNLLIQLVQETARYEEASIGFLVIKTANGKKLRGGDFGNDDIFCKPDGWVPKVDVVCRAKVEPDLKDNIFIIIPSTFKPDMVRPFSLTVRADEDFSLVQL